MIAPEIRRIRADEGQLFKAIRLRALADSPEAFGTTLAEAIVQSDDYWEQRAITSASSNTRCVVIAVADNRWIGLAGGMFEEEKFLIADFVSLWVDPSSRRLGLAIGLFEAVADWARECGARQIQLWVTETNEPAKRLYRRLGFVDTGESAPVREDSSLRELRMSRDL